MGEATIQLGLGFGGGKLATSSGRPIGTTGFNISLRLPHSTIIARSGDPTGTIAFGTDTDDLYVYDGANWQIYFNN